MTAARAAWWASLLMVLLTAIIDESWWHGLAVAGVFALLAIAAAIEGRK